MNETQIDNVTRTAQIDAEIARLQNERFELNKDISTDVRNAAYKLIDSESELSVVDVYYHKELVDEDFANEISKLLFDKKAKDLIDEENQFLHDLIVEACEMQCDLLKDQIEDIKEDAVYLLLNAIEETQQ